MQSNEMTNLSESAPLAQIARFDDWQKVPGGFEMAYNPGPNDYLLWTLGPDFKPGPYDVPFSGRQGNGIDGRLYGNNTIKTADPPVGFCSAFVNSCCKK